MTPLMLQIYNQYKNLNESPYKIAKDLNISPRTIYYYLKKMNIQEKRTGEILPNQKFNYLTTIQIIKKSHNGTNIWKCICECGNNCEASTSSLKNNTKISCGCIIKSKNGDICKQNWYGKNHGRYSGIEELSGNLFSYLKNSAKRRKINFNITKDELWNLWKKQNGKCAITNIKIFLKYKKSKLRTASLDRIDSRKDYTIDNVHWIHKIVNRIKLSMSIIDLYKWSKLIVNKKIYYNTIDIISKDFLCDLKHNSKRRKIDLLITYDDIHQQWQSQNGCCFLTGIPLKISGKDCLLRTASLDRINNNINYIKSNIVFTHKILNLSRGNLKLNNYIKWMEIIYDNLQKLGITS